MIQERNQVEAFVVELISNALKTGYPIFHSKDVFTSFKKMLCFYRSENSVRLQMFLKC